MLRLHRALTAAVLADSLADLLAVPLADPFAAEVVAVPAKGVERWLGQRLSGRLGAVDGRGDGVAANVEFPSPTALVADAVAAASGYATTDDPWSSGRILWTLLSVLDEVIAEPWAAVLAKHLGTGRDDHRVGRRYGTAAHIADLFRRYGADRPQLLVDWSAGADTDGIGGPLAADQLWQAHLWRALRDRIGVASPAERLDDACARLVDAPDLVALPERLSVFGPTRLTTEQLRVITALGARRDVHLWVPHPSPAMWQRLTGVTGSVRRSDDDSALLVAHPLLASLARDVREMQRRVLPIVDDDAEHTGGPLPASLLGRMQADLAADRAPVHAAEPDGSVQVHSCHGAPRQVEVLRECLLHLFADDPTLEPRDVVVMCPDIETFAPLIRAAFGQGVLDHPGHRLRVSLADRALRQTNPLFDVLATVLLLADGRVTASQLLDLAGSGPVRRRFGFTDEELERLRDWAGASGARWGISQRQRSAFGLGDFPQNTFNTALDRILLGVAADETALGWLDRTLPLDDVESNDIDLAGRFAEFVDRVAVVLHDLSGALPTADWIAALTRALDLLVDVPHADAWQLGQCNRELAAAAEHGAGVVMRLSDVRAMLSNRLAGRPTRANFRTGDLTVATLVPMRSVPHRVVVLLGLDDEVYPRGASSDGDDVLARTPCAGERDPRSEDRQLLLDAVMSAREKLLVFYTGADPVTGAPHPPAVPVGELIDTVSATIGTNARESVVVQRHPLQTFDPRNFDAAEPFSFDTGALAGARAAAAAPAPVPPFLAATLSPLSPDDVSLADLVAFLRHPIQAFLQQRLRLRVPEPEEDVADVLSAELDGLAKWAIGDRMLKARLAGAPLDDLCSAEWRRGTLPPFKLGSAVLDDVARTVEALVSAAESVHVGSPEMIDVALDLGDGRRLVGTVTDVYGEVVATTYYSKLQPRHRLEAWVRLLAVSAARRGRWTAVTTGRGYRTLRRSTLVAPHDPIAVLRELVDLRDRGVQAPLPISAGASAVYAERRHGGRSVEEADEAAEAEWSGKFGDCTDRILAYLYGPSPMYAEFAAAEPLADERAWAPDPTRFGVLACRLWLPLLAAETVRQP